MSNNITQFIEVTPSSSGSGWLLRFRRWKGEGRVIAPKCFPGRNKMKHPPSRLISHKEPFEFSTVLHTACRWRLRHNAHPTAGAPGALVFFWLLSEEERGGKAIIKGLFSRSLTLHRPLRECRSLDAADLLRSSLCVSRFVFSPSHAVRNGLLGSTFRPKCSFTLQSHFFRNDSYKSGTALGVETVESFTCARDRGGSLSNWQTWKPPAMQCDFDASMQSALQISRLPLK